MKNNWKKVASNIEELIKNKVKEANANGIVLGISGGLDSAIVACLCKRAGFNTRGSTNRLYLYYLPEEIDREGTDFKDIVELCIKFGLCYNTYSIGEIVSNMANKICRCSKEDKIAYGNILSRLRMTMLYSCANVDNCIVIGTTNKSEYHIGYFTKWGDGACDLEPILHLYKSDLYDFARYLGIPKCIINKVPSAGLWEGQSDEEEIGMSYEKLDAILKSLIDNNHSDLIAQGISLEDRSAVFKMIIKTNHKRDEIMNIYKGEKKYGSSLLGC